MEDGVKQVMNKMNFNLSFCLLFKQREIRMEKVRKLFRVLQNGQIKKKEGEKIILLKLKEVTACSSL